MFEEIYFYVFLFLSGLFSGVFAGLLGLGGAVVLIPVLIYVPSVFGLHDLDMKNITGITALQTLFASASSSYFHSKSGNVNYLLVKRIGISLALFSFLGSVFSKCFSSRALLILYALMIGSAGVLMLFQFRKNDHNNTPQNPKISNLTYLAGLIVGLPSGALGLAGGVILIPIINTVFQFPLNISISTSTHLALIASAMSFSGKFFTGQVELLVSFIVSISAVCGAYIGSMLNKSVKPEILRVVLLVVIFTVFLKIVFDLIF